MSGREQIRKRGGDWSFDFLVVTGAVISILLVVLINLFLWFFSR
jgi:hypothetical protein